MKRLAIQTAAVLTVCLIVCTVSLIGLNRTLDEAHDMATVIYAAMENGKKDEAREQLVALATFWDDRAAVLELLCSHDDLHEVKEHIIQARICIDYKDPEEFYSAVALIGEGIEHIRDEEALSLSNLY